MSLFVNVKGEVEARSDNRTSTNTNVWNKKIPPHKKQTNKQTNDSNLLINTKKKFFLKNCLLCSICIIDCLRRFIRSMMEIFIDDWYCLLYRHWKICQHKWGKKIFFFHSHMLSLCEIAINRILWSDSIVMFFM